MKPYRNGSYTEVWYPYEESLSVGSTDMSMLERLDKSTSILSIYGIKDDVVDLEDAAQFAKVLNPRHTLELIPEADHNFYGPSKDGQTKKSNYNPIVVDLVTQWYSEENERARFMSTNKYSGIVSRWKDIDGVSNFRDFGGYPTAVEGLSVRPGLLFRAANLSQVTQAGKLEIARLGIKTVFDLRSMTERDRIGVAQIPGVEVRWVPVFKEQDLSPEVLAKRYQNFFDPVKGFEEAYREILSKAGPSYRQIFLHIRDRPDDGIVVHCTAGKDRTGVLCALILLLMEVDYNTIAREYEMTTYGLRDEIPRIMKAIEHEKDNWNAEGMLQMLSSKYEAMMGTIVMINRDFGGVVHYLKSSCGLTDEDLDQIKTNLSDRGIWKFHSAL